MAEYGNFRYTELKCDELVVVAKSNPHVLKATPAKSFSLNAIFEMPTSTPLVNHLEVMHVVANQVPEVEMIKYLTFISDLDQNNFIV